MMASLKFSQKRSTLAHSYVEMSNVLKYNGPQFLVDKLGQPIEKQPTNTGNKQQSSQLSPQKRTHQEMQSEAEDNLVTFADDEV